MTGKPRKSSAVARTIHKFFTQRKTNYGHYKRIQAIDRYNRNLPTRNYMKYKQLMAVDRRKRYHYAMQSRNYRKYQQFMAQDRWRRTRAHLNNNIVFV